MNSNAPSQDISRSRRHTKQRRRTTSDPTPSLNRVILHGTIQQTPASGAASDVDMPLDELTAEAADYDQAYTELEQRLPEGWRLIAVRRS